MALRKNCTLTVRHHLSVRVQFFRFSRTNQLILLTCYSFKKIKNPCLSTLLLATRCTSIKQQLKKLNLPTKKSDLRRDRFVNLHYLVMISSINFGALVGSFENSIYLYNISITLSTF